MQYDVFYKRANGICDHSVIEAERLSAAVAFVETAKGGDVYRAAIRLFVVNDYDPIEEPERKGYDIVDREGMMEVQRLDSIGLFEDDISAVYAAIENGVDVIPVEELPADFPYRWLGWVDSPKNRKAIQNFCERQSQKIVMEVAV